MTSLYCVEITALTSRVTSFDDDLTPVVEEKETPESVDEVTTATLQRNRSSCDEEHVDMDVKMSSSDSDPDSHKHEGSLHSQICHPFCWCLQWFDIVGQGRQGRESSSATGHSRRPAQKRGTAYQSTSGHPKLSLHSRVA